VPTKAKQGELTVSIANKCSVDKCSTNNFCKQMCQKHYVRYLRYGDVNYISKVANYNGENCRYKGCSDPIRAKGLCNTHWTRLNRRGELGPVEKESFRHNLSFHPLYSTWEGMIARCYRKTSKAYKNYGGRGITVCIEWRNFAVFLEDMGEKPGSQYSLDRIDNDGNYCKINCKWSTWEEQASNRRKKQTLL